MPLLQLRSLAPPMRLLSALMMSVQAGITAAKAQGRVCHRSASLEIDSASLAARFVHDSTMPRAVSLQIQKVAEQNGSCRTFVSVAWEPLGGGIVVLDSLGSLQAVEPYPMPQDVRLMPGNRLSFRHLAARGSGHWEERFVVLCSMGTDVWIECLNIPYRTELTAYAADRGLDWLYIADVDMHGDSVTVRPRVSFGPPGSRDRTSRQLGTTVFHLP